MNVLRHFCFTLLLGVTALLGACASSPSAVLAPEKPVLELSQYLNGRLVAHGMFHDRSGKVIRRFVVDMEGRWQGANGVLDERFTYSDGTTERRIWRLHRGADGQYTGRADDVVGEALGRSVGNAFRWAYTLRLPVDGRTIDVQLDDWMTLIDDKTLLNRATMSKFGIRLGEVTLSFTKLP
jgi:Protein of unknown function (DUF3833)